MNSLTIEQSNLSTELVGTGIIDKLYRLALISKVADANNDLTMSLQGNITASAAYEDAVLYLRAKFPNLTINIIDNNYYIRFKDSVIENSMVSNYSTDGIGVTASLLAAVRLLGTSTGLKPFNINNHLEITNSTTFPEFKYFTGVTDFLLAIYGEGGGLPSWSLSELTMPQTTMYWSSNNIVKGPRYDNHISISHITWNGATLSYTGNRIYTHPRVFQNVDISYYDGILPVQQEMPPMFIGNAVLGKMIYPEGVTSVNDNFQGCYITYIEFPTTIQDVYELFYLFRQDALAYGILPETGCMVFKSVTPPTFHPYNQGNSSTSTRNALQLDYHARSIEKIYVPDGSVQAYKTKWAQDDPQLATVSTGNSGKTIIDKIYPMSEMSDTELAMGTVTTEDMNRV